MSDGWYPIESAPKTYVTLPHAAACATITLQNKSEHLVVVGGASGAILLPGGVYEVGLDGAVTVTQRSEAENAPPPPKE